MKKLLTLSITLAILGFVASCGVQRPYPLTISLINSTGVPYEQQGGMAIRTNQLSNVKADWDVTETGAHGVIIVASPANDYNCSTELATAQLWVTNSKNVNNIGYTDNLAEIFAASISKFTAGRYAFCLKAVAYDSYSAPSLPVFVELLDPTQFAMGYGYYR